MIQTDLKKLLDYSENTGEFFWKVDKGRKKAGSLAGTYHKSTGYWFIKINQKRYLLHRLAFIWMKGYLPECVDHKNGNTSDNRWCNLREASLSENLCNTKRYKNNTSGVKGVYFISKENKWGASISFLSKRKYLGSFITIEEAKATVEKARAEYHKEYARNA